MSDDREEKQRAAGRAQESEIDVGSQGPSEPRGGHWGPLASGLDARPIMVCWRGVMEEGASIS